MRLCLESLSHISIYFQQWATFARTWHIYDCTWQNPFQSAFLIKNHLMGLNKPIYHPMSK